MIEPRNDTFIVELVSHQKTDTGLEIARKEEDKHLRAGKILGVPKNANELKLNDVVIFGEYATASIYYEGKKFTFVNSEDIIGKVVKE